MTAFYTGKPRIAIGRLRRCLRHSDAENSHVRKAFALLGAAYSALGRHALALETFDTGLGAVGNDPELHFSMAGVLAGLGRFAQAREHYLAIDPDTSGFFSSINIGILSFLRLNNLASVCMAMGLSQEAKQHLREAIAGNPAYLPSATALFEAGTRTGDIVAAREAASAVFAASGACEMWASMRVGIAELAGVDVDQELLRLSQENPQGMGPALILSRRLLERGRMENAVGLLSHLEYLGCAEAAHHLANRDLNRGDLAGAAGHVRTALQLNPGNSSSLDLEQRIEPAMFDREPAEPYTGGYGADALVGPHVGCLGEASLARSVVVVSYNSSATISECVRRVLDSLGAEDELIVVENASLDDTAAKLAAIDDTRLRVLGQEANLGYSKACNLGILATRGAIIALLNPDAFVSPGWLEGLSAQLEGNVAAVGPVSDYVAGGQFAARYLFGPLPEGADISAMLQRQFAGRSDRTKMLMGLCLVLRRETLDRHGLLYEPTRLGADDLELSWRLQELGYELRVVPGVFVRHVGGVSFGSMPSLERAKQIRRSDRALLQRLKAYYGDRPLPTSQEIWGCDIFAEAMARRC